MQKFKVILVVVGLLMVGFVGGFLTNRYLVTQKVKHFRQLNRGQNFGEYFLTKIDASSDQQQQLQPILKGYGESFRALSKQHQAERLTLTDSLFSEITPLLTEEQQESGQKWRRYLVRGSNKSSRKRKQNK